MRTFDSPPPVFAEPSMCEDSPESFATRANSAASDPGAGLIYDLRSGMASSDRFYADLAALSSRTATEIDRQAASALDGYSQYVAATLREVPRTRGEYALELLTLGMALRLYGGIATSTPAWVIGICRELYWMRRRWPRLKPAIDWMRAGISQLFMRRKLRLETEFRAGSAVSERFEGDPAARLAALPRMIEWMHATGEFVQEARRLDNWSAYLKELPWMQAERCSACVRPVRLVHRRGRSRARDLHPGRDSLPHENIPATFLARRSALLHSRARGISPRDGCSGCDE